MKNNQRSRGAKQACRLSKRLVKDSVKMAGWLIEENGKLLAAKEQSRKRLEQAEETNASLMRSNDLLRENYSKFRDENNNLRQENSQLRDRNTALDINNIQLNEENARLRRENLSLGNAGGLKDAGEARQADGPPSPRDPAGPPL